MEVSQLVDMKAQVTIQCTSFIRILFFVFNYEGLALLLIHTELYWRSAICQQSCLQSKVARYLSVSCKIKRIRNEQIYICTQVAHIMCIYICN